MMTTTRRRRRGRRRRVADGEVMVGVGITTPESYLGRYLSKPAGRKDGWMEVCCIYLFIPSSFLF